MASAARTVRHRRRASSTGTRTTSRCSDFETRLDVPFGGDERWIEVAPPADGNPLYVVERG
jgi:hypothetical protein